MRCRRRPASKSRARRHVTNNGTRYYRSRRVIVKKIQESRSEYLSAGTHTQGPGRHLPGRPERGTVDTADGCGEADGHADRGRSESLPGLRTVRFSGTGRVRAAW